MNAETKILTPGECLAEIRPRLAEMMTEIQGMLEGYPMDSRTRSELGSARFSLKMILED